MNINSNSRTKAFEATNSAQDCAKKRSASVSRCAHSNIAAVALHYAYYNFVKSNIAIRCTPAMAAGVANSLWTVRDLVEMVKA